MKKISILKHVVKATVNTLMVTALINISGVNVQFVRADVEQMIDGELFEFEDDNDYEVSAQEADESRIDDTCIGQLKISGKFAAEEQIDGVDSFRVADQNLALSFELNDSEWDETDDGWSISDDGGDVINGFSIDEKIHKGALLLQTSLDGETWVNDVVITDIFEADSEKTNDFYVTRDIQLQNGCYYRVIVAYEKQRQIDDKKVLFVSLDNYEYKKYAQLYEFYAYTETDTSSSSDTPRRELGEKINAGKDTGYSKSNVIDEDDPHYGWNIGTFFVNGYTREVADDSGNSVFLKNLGDKVTLWFNLEQDINCLNGNDELIIAEDDNGYDRYFETPKTNFKHGALIIRYTNEEGVKSDPIIYTDYLAANTRTGADTRAQLFEEGDYEVALDYEVKNDPRKISSVSILPEYTDYRIYFKFSIRNGNCMVYPFDVETGAELSDNAITENGFKLDMAKSKYLMIDVTRSILKPGNDGTLTEDIRYNRPAKDGDEYTEEGIYTFDVTNQYTGQHVVKTIYVGNDSYLRALSKGNTIKEINDVLSSGGTVMDDGSLKSKK